MGAQPAWWIRGEYYEACSCASACPCVFKSPPTLGHCHSLQAWQITDGHYGTVPLNGTAAVMVLIVPGNFWSGGFRVGVYVDAKASPAQQEALGAIFSGRAGGPRKYPTRLIKELLWVKAAPMEYEIHTTWRRFAVPGVLDFTLDTLDCENPDGRPARIVDSMHFLKDCLVGKARRASFSDGGIAWDYQGCSAFYGVFDDRGP